MTYTVTISGVSPDPEVYAGLVKATAYIGAILGPAAQKWRDLTPDDKGRSLFSATQYIDSRGWDGAPTFAGGTTLQFPRSGGSITDNAATQLANVEKAVYELAMAFASTPALQTAADTGSNVKMVDADGAKVEFWKATSAQDGSAPSMPPNVQRYIGRYSVPPASPNGGYSFGTDGESDFDDCDEMDLSRPL